MGRDPARVPASRSGERVVRVQPGPAEGQHSLGADSRYLACPLTRLAAPRLATLSPQTRRGRVQTEFAARAAIPLRFRLALGRIMRPCAAHAWRAPRIPVWTTSGPVAPPGR